MSGHEDILPKWRKNGTARTYNVRDLKRLPVLKVRIDEPRPKTRGDCKDGPRPCPWVGCKYHLYLDVNEHTGSVKYNYPNKDPEDLEESCALDVADRDGLTLDEVGQLLNLSRERIRQMEEYATSLLKTALKFQEAHGRLPRRGLKRG
jgi:hypothetical protein